MAKPIVEKGHVTPHVRFSETEPVERLSVPMKDNGTRIDWERVRESRRGALKDLLAREAPAATPTSASADVFTGAWVATMLDALGHLEVTIAMRVYACSREDAAVLIYSDAEKRMLTDPIVRVLNKYSGVLFAQYGDEVALAGLLVTIGLGKVTTLRATLDARATPAMVIPQAQSAPLSQGDIM
jgi:hypothetical protein